MVECKKHGMVFAVGCAACVNDDMMRYKAALEDIQKNTREAFVARGAFALAEVVKKAHDALNPDSEKKA